MSHNRNLRFYHVEDKDLYCIQNRFNSIEDSIGHDYDCTHIPSYMFQKHRNQSKFCHDIHTNVFNGLRFKICVCVPFWNKKEKC